MRKILIVLYLLLLACVSKQSFAQWELRYPPMLTNGITDMVFLNDNNGYAINLSGGILKTIDGGVNWTISKHFQRECFSEIHFIDQLNGFIISPHSYIGDSKDFINTTDGGFSWSAQYIGVSDAITTLPLSISEILKSGDQGTISKLDNFFGLWSIKYTMPKYFGGCVDISYGDIKDFAKLTSGRILALGSSWSAFQNLVISDSAAFILFSDNSGNTWDTLWCDLPEILPTFSFSDNSNGWLAGNDNKIYSSVDGGVTWTLKYSDPGAYNNITKILAVDNYNIYASSSNGTIIFSNDGGNTWQISTLIPSGYEFFFNMYFINSQKGFVFGPDLWVTSNSGNSFGKVSEAMKPTFTKIQFINMNVGFGIGGNNFYGGSSFFKTTDGGYNWITAYEQNTGGSFNGFYMIDSLKGWITSDHRLLKTSDGGLSWEEVFLDSLLEFVRGVEFFNENLGLVFEVRQRFNDYTLNYLTTDGGITWTKYVMGDQPYLSSFLKVKRTDPSHLWVVNQQGVWLSSDSAKSWTNINSEVSGWAGAFDFLDSLNGWVAHMDAWQDKFKYTTDGGITWSTVLKPYMVQTQDLVIDGRNYFGRIQVTAAGLYGSLFEYEEGWPNAYIQNTFTDNWLTSISVYRSGNTAHKWVAGMGGIILYSTEYITDLKEEKEQILNSFSLLQNYPNPFNPSTTLKFQLPKGEHVSLKVFDILGNEVATLVNEYKPAGMYEIEFSADGLTSGVYFYQLKSHEFLETKKMIVLR